VKIVNEYTVPLDLINKIKLELKNNNININDDNFINTDEYKKVKDKYIKVDNSIWKIFLPIEYFVEKYIISIERINKIKKGKYDIGTKRELHKNELTYNALCEYIADIIDTDDALDLENIRQ
jgi:hypothetical protein